MSPLVPRSRGSQIYLTILVGVVVGLGFVAVGSWRVGILVVGVSFVVAALARVLVPQAHVGMLRVRGKVFDVAWTATLGGALVVLSFVVPPGPV